MNLKNEKALDVSKKVFEPDDEIKNISFWKLWRPSMKKKYIRKLCEKKCFKKVFYCSSMKNKLLYEFSLFPQNHIAPSTTLISTQLK